MNAPFQIVGVTVTPHIATEGMLFPAPADPPDGARVEIYLRNASPGVLHTSEATFDGKYPLRLVMEGLWSWHDTAAGWPAADVALPPGALTVWAFNGVKKPWVAGKTFSLAIEDWESGVRASVPVTLPRPTAWLSAVTFLGDGPDIRPDRIVVHIANAGKAPLALRGIRLWLPRPGGSWRTFHRWDAALRTAPFLAGPIPPGETGGLTLRTGPLPLGYAVLEIETSAGTLWARQRVRRETFDISGGWVHDSRTTDGRPSVVHEPFLKTLKRLHIDTAHLVELPGYTDETGPGGLYTRYPLRRFGHLLPPSKFDTDDELPRLHAAETLGEPQFGGGSGQKLPQAVKEALDVFGPSRIASTVTLSDASTWRYYAGLSDYPHYDAYRVSAPAADAWRLYPWPGGVRIGWGSPLEGIGAMCRSLRAISRPKPTAYWSQGPHRGWDVYDGRTRTSPTPDELRLQAWYALSSRVTSLYWFNLSLGSLVKFPDLLEPLETLGREMRLLERFFLEGDAYRWRREGDWELSTLAAPDAALLTALDDGYAPDPATKTFVFPPARPARFAFALPVWLRRPAAVFAVDGAGVREVVWEATPKGVAIDDTARGVAVYVAARDAGLRAQLEARRRELAAQERAVGFDPARNAADLAVLKAISRPGE